ncbi:hypothetical protein Dimus_007322, partial [Dionaea muscipula]
PWRKEKGPNKEIRWSAAEQATGGRPTSRHCLDGAEQAAGQAEVEPPSKQSARVLPIRQSTEWKIEDNCRAGDSGCRREGNRLTMSPNRQMGEQGFPATSGEKVL